jgi:ABC-type multidrug transport system ATPase subunit/ABC-type multidrug transport system permease subunit
VTTIIEDILSKVLSVKEDHKKIIDCFFHPKILDPTVQGNNELFILRPSSELKDNLEGSWIESNIPKDLSVADYFYFRGLNHLLKALYIGNFKIFFIIGHDPEIRIHKDGRQTICNWELIEPGDSVSIEENVVIDYSELKNLYLREKFNNKIFLEARDLSFSYAMGKGIKALSLQLETGMLVGIFGKEGTGKSTVLKLLAGELLPQKGDIRINGYSLQKDLYYMKGMIGYVPEEDLLYDELTVSENLYFTARLYLGKLDEATLTNKVENLLRQLNLTVIKDQVVGRIGDKNILPDQRRLLNIALELIREPQILIVDNSLAPLSVNDSPKILEVLSEYSFKGHIVITSIVQTTATSLRLFDNFLIIDEGGFPVYHGKLNDAWKHFLPIFEMESCEMKEIEPSSIIQFISQPVYSDKHETYERYKSPGELYKEFRKSNKSNDSKSTLRKVLPDNILSTPSLERQYMIFNLRNFKTKLARKWDLIYTILVSPFLASILTLLMRGSNHVNYSLSKNPYIPAFYFISILFSVVMGLVLSANEIHRERNIIHKEAYLNISYFSYINSKITYLFIIILVQSFLFALISSIFLEIKRMLLIHWLILFSCQSFGMLLGLILSGSHKRIENFYLRSIPLILILLLLLGGGFIKFDTFPGERKNTPFISDFMISRWAYEALLVYQYRENKYMKPLYNYKRNIAVGTLYSENIIPLLQERINRYIQNPASVKDSMNSYCKIIRNSLLQVATHFEVFPYENIRKITPKDFNVDLANDLNDYLEYIDLYFYSMTDQAITDINKYMKRISDSLGKGYLIELRNTQMNDYIESEVTGTPGSQKIKIVGDELVIIDNPIYQYPVSDLGRTRLFIPEKKINGKLIDTVEFDISIIWLINLFLYILLVFDVFDITRTRIKPYFR